MTIDLRKIAERWKHEEEIPSYLKSLAQERQQKDIAALLDFAVEQRNQYLIAICGKSEHGKHCDDYHSLKALCELDLKGVWLRE